MMEQETVALHTTLIAASGCGRAVEVGENGYLLNTQQTYPSEAETKVMRMNIWWRPWTINASNAIKISFPLSQIRIKPWRTMFYMLPVWKLPKKTHVHSLALPVWRVHSSLLIWTSRKVTEPLELCQWIKKQETQHWSCEIIMLVYPCKM